MTADQGEREAQERASVVGDIIGLLEGRIQPKPAEGFSGDMRVFGVDLTEGLPIVAMTLDIGDQKRKRGQATTLSLPVSPETWSSDTIRYGGDPLSKVGIDELRFVKEGIAVALTSFENEESIPCDPYSPFARDEFEDYSIRIWHSREGFVLPFSDDFPRVRNTIGELKRNLNPKSPLHKLLAEALVVTNNRRTYLDNNFRRNS